MIGNVVRILMERDGRSEASAMTMIKECQERLIDEAIPTGDYELAVEIIEEELGLEPDYMMDLL